MDQILFWMDRINNLVWGTPLLVLITFVGLYLTFRLRGIQFRRLWYAHKLAFMKDDSKGAGDISHFQALMTALAATIGIGSITGVATAIAIGGLGSIFWMWVAALLGMATKYGEAILAIKYRVVDEHGEMCGGPMHYLYNGLKSRWLAGIFAVFAAVTAFGTGNMVQSNSVAEAVKALIPTIDPIYIGIILMVATGLPLIGGIKSISKVVSVVVPSMAIFYLVSCLIVVGVNIEAVPKAFQMIFKSAFTGQAAAGGFLGSTVMMAIQYGVSRGIFSSEAGLGTSSIAAAAARSDSPGRQALVSMSTVFITTGIVCTLTGLVIATTGVLGSFALDGTLLTGSGLAIKAFDAVLPHGGLLVTIAIIPFAYSTILGWAYYGEKSMEYLFGVKSTPWYRAVYTVMVFFGAILNLKIVWGFANIMNGLMAFPNLIGLILLAGVIAKESALFEKSLDAENQKPEIASA
jgi:AGCS family alanine or glycine:cation symporter